MTYNISGSFATGATINDDSVCKQIPPSGRLSFPITDFDANGDLHREGDIKRLEWLAPCGASALCAAGATGERFSLTHGQYSDIIKTAVDTCHRKVPVLAGAGGPVPAPLTELDAAECEVLARLMAKQGPQQAS